MIRIITLITSLFYLISCTSSDQTALLQARQTAIPKPVKTSNPVPDVKAMEAFNTFLKDIADYQMIAAGHTELQETIRKFLPDSTISHGFDVHLREIGSIDTFRLIYHEYFDLYDDWSKAYLSIFSLEGKVLLSKRLQELSFEGNTSINIIDGQLIEIAYHDFFSRDDSPESLVILRPSTEELQHEGKKNRRKKRRYQYTSIYPDKVEGTIYEYYKILDAGGLQSLSKANTFSAGRRYPQASFRLLSLAELKSLNKADISLLKAELLAEHGYIFQDDNSANYFKNQKWYEARHEHVDSLLSDIERYNYQLLLNLEKDY